MGVVHHRDGPVLRTDHLEPAAHGVQRRKRAQHLPAVEPQQRRRTVNGQQVIGIEPSEQSDPHLRAVDAQQHPVEVRLDDPAAEIGHRPQRIGAHPRRGVLHHDAAVAVVGVRQREGPRGQAVEEALLRPDVFGEGLVVVEVVVRQIREDAAREDEPPRALLHDGVRGALHEAEFAPGVGHLAHHGVQADRVGRRVRRPDFAAVDPIDHRRDQPRAVAQRPHQVVEQRGGRRLAVRAGDAHQLQLAARMAVECRGHVGQRPGRIADAHVGHPGSRLGGHPRADHRRGAPSDGRRNEVVAVGLRSRHGEETVARPHGARIERESSHGDLRIAVQRPDGRPFQNILQSFHLSPTL